MLTPSRVTSGVQTQNQEDFFGGFPLPSPFEANIFAQDLNQYIAGDWTVTTAAGGSTALLAGNGGILRLTSGAANNDIQHNLKNPAAFAFTAGYSFWFLVNLALDNVANTGLIAGVQAGGTAFAPTDGVYFSKGAGANVDFVVRAASTSTTISAVTTMAAATRVALGFFYDPLPSGARIHVFSSTGMTAGQAYQANRRNVIGGRFVNVQSTMTNLPVAATNLSPAVGIQTLEAVAHTLDVDYLLCANELARF